MADLRVKKQGEEGKPLGSGKVVIPLWPFLLLIVVVAAGLLLWWPHPRQTSYTYFNPVTGQNHVIAYENRRFTPVPDATHHQVTVDPTDMYVIGKADGQEVYAPRRAGVSGGGGGAHVLPPTGLYLRSGNDLFVPLQEVK